MGDQLDADKVAENMRLALPMMKKFGVPMTPENYSVWYEHVSGQNAALSSRINDLANKKEQFSEGDSKALYEEFFSIHKERTNVLEMRKELARVLREVLNFVSSSASDSEKVNSHLNGLVTKINRDMSPDELHQVINEVIMETRLAMSNGELLTERLNSAVSEVSKLRQELQETKREAKSDALTGLANRSAFDDVVTKVTEDADSSGLDVCLIFSDLDHFKKINDTHGHLVGDQVLRVMANVMRDSVKGRDLVARYGGEEFAIVLLNTSLQNAKIVANNIREEIAAKRIQRKDTREALGQITMSFGIARYVATEGVESFMQRADRALYMSKRKGRNTVSEAPPPII
jgi:diguanylate cyclase